MIASMLPERSSECVSEINFDFVLDGFSTWLCPPLGPNRRRPSTRGEASRRRVNRRETISFSDLPSKCPPRGCEGAENGRDTKRVFVAPLPSTAPDGESRREVLLALSPQ